MNKEILKINTPFRIRVFSGKSDTGEWRILKHPAQRWQDEILLYPNSEPDIPYSDGDAVKIATITAIWNKAKKANNGTWYKTTCVACDIVRVSEHEAPPDISETDIDAMSLDDIMPF